MPNPYRWIEFSLVSFCKNFCDYCPQKLYASTYGKYQAMSFETFKKCLNNIPEDFYIHFSGFAEPWLNPLATEFLKYSSEIGRKIHIYSTLIGMEWKDVEELVKTKSIEKLCIHTPDTENLMKVTIGEEYFKKLEYILKNINKNMQLEVMCIGKPYEESVKLADKYGVIKGFNNFNSLISRASNVNSKIVQNIPKKLGKLRCMRSSELKQSVVLPDGRLTTCCCAYQIDPVLGNLAEEHYGIIYDRSITKFIDKMNEEDSDIICRGCEWSSQI